MLSIRNLEQFYGGSHTLWDVTMDIPKGSVTCLMGRNGMGKTTLLRCVMGLVNAKSGQILYDGQKAEVDLRTVSAEQRSRLGIGYVPQGARSLPSFRSKRTCASGCPYGRHRRKVCRSISTRCFRC